VARVNHPLELSCFVTRTPLHVYVFYPCVSRCEQIGIVSRPPMTRAYFYSSGEELGVSVAVNFLPPHPRLLSGSH